MSSIFMFRVFRHLSPKFTFFLLMVLSVQSPCSLAQEKPAARTVYLDELDLSLAKSATKPAQRNLSVSGVPLSLNGRRFDRGVGLQTPASIRLLLPENVQRFHAFVGVDDAASSGSAPVEFFIEAGNMSLWKSGPVKRGDAPREVNLNIEKTRKYRGGIEEITLSAQPVSDPNGGVPVNWADAWFTCAGDPAPKTIALPVTEPYLLTPPPPPQPPINGPRVYGARPGSPFLYAIPATGNRPMRFAAEGLPEGLSLNPETGHITGSTTKEGTHRVRLQARNASGETERELRLMIGDKICLTPPLGWNSWNCWAATVDDAKIRAAARAMVESGLAQHGWTYVNIDDGWQGKRNASPTPSRGTKSFPTWPRSVKASTTWVLRLGSTPPRGSRRTRDTRVGRVTPRTAPGRRKRRDALPPALPAGGTGRYPSPRTTQNSGPRGVSTT
jgi:alpha-galactosidase